VATLCLRWPAGEQVTRGRSRCDGCGRALGPLELVPVVSALASDGRCRTCGAAIDRFHLWVELGAAAIGGVALALSPDASGAALALFGWLLLPLAILDARHLWLPDRLTLLLAVAGLLVGGFLLGVALPQRLIGGGAGFVALWLIGRGYRAVRGREGLGAGDPKLLGAIGLWMGWAALPAVLLGASLIGLVFAVARGRGASSMVAFGTLLAAGAMLCAAAALQVAAVRALIAG
jgi:leader peptidase (prepilin peptidase)/N-methyltransferase